MREAPAGSCPRCSRRRTLASARDRPGAGSRKEVARRRWYRRGPWRVQLRISLESTLEQYVAQQLWRTATLRCCPLHPGQDCGLSRWGTYGRKFPTACRIARFYCRRAQTTFSLLPDCLAARMPGTLEQVQRAAQAVQDDLPLERAADELRPPAEQLQAIALSSAVQWTRRRHAAVMAVLLAVAGLMPDTFAGCPVTLEGFAVRLGTENVLVSLREIAAEHLHRLPSPLGFVPRTARLGPEDNIVRGHDGSFDRDRLHGKKNFQDDHVVGTPSAEADAGVESLHTMICLQQAPTRESTPRSRTCARHADCSGQPRWSTRGRPANACPGRVAMPRADALRAESSALRVLLIQHGAGTLALRAIRPQISTNIARPSRTYYSTYGCKTGNSPTGRGRCSHRYLMAAQVRGFWPKRLPDSLVTSPRQNPPQRSLAGQP